MPGAKLRNDLYRARLKMTRTPLKYAFGLALLFALAVAIYLPGINGPFLFDDRENITSIPVMKMSTLSLPGARDAMFAWGTWYPDRGLARLSFALNYYFAGGRFDSFAFKLTNVAIHLLNGLLVYWLSVLLLRRYAGGARPSSAEEGWSAMQSYLPLLVTALWLLHPIQLTSVLYVVQRMTSMAAFFMLAGLVLFVVGRIRLESGQSYGLTWMFVGLAGGVGLGFLCKQNSVLLPFYAFLVEMFFFRNEALPRAVRRRLYGFYALTVVLPALMAVAVLVFAWDVFAQAYLHQDFTPWERLLTQSRVLFFYLGLLLFPHIRAFGLYHDDIALSTGWLEPWTTLLSVLSWVGLLGLALWGVRRRAVWSFAALWYLVGHSLESSILSLELVFEHRNYLPSFGVLFAVAYYLLWGLQRLVKNQRLIYSVAGLLVLVLAFTTFTRAGAWGDKYTVIEFSLRNHPNSSRTHGEYAVSNAQRAGDIELAYNHWARAAQLNSSSVLELIEMERVLAAQILAFAQQDRGTESLSTKYVAPTDYAEPMAPDLAYLKALDGLVAAEISGRLKTGPMLMGNVAGLRSLEQCIFTNLEPCTVLLARAIEWFELASENPRSLDIAGAVLRLGLAKLYAYGGQIEKAVDSAEAAVRTDPGQIHFLFELAAFYLFLEDLDAAERIILAAEKKMDYSGFRHGVLRDLKHNLDKARENEKRASATGG
jgi:tetratricopeptide (TPR) repeat protein